MKYSVGYQMRRDPDFIECILRNKEKIHEVYFSWGDFANGRNSQLRQIGLTPWEAQRRQEEELKLLAEEGISFNLLFNATCYGRDSQSKAFFHKIGETVAYIQEEMCLSSITTTSPLIAKFIKENFEEMDVRASVNMSIGTIEGMDYVAEWFDSFYVKREWNRDFRKLEELKAWSDSRGKRLYGLANSGCLNHCSAHVFHDNLVSHESEISAMDNGYAFEGICKTYLKKKENAHALLDQTSFIRPEDVHLYENIFEAVKLATRVTPYPARILQAYVEKERYTGNILDLLEPNHTALFYPYLLENRRIKSEISGGKLIYSDLEKAFIDVSEMYESSIYKA